MISVIPAISVIPSVSTIIATTTTTTTTVMARAIITITTSIATSAITSITTTDKFERRLVCRRSTQSNSFPTNTYSSFLVGCIPSIFSCTPFSLLYSSHTLPLLPTFCFSKSAIRSSTNSWGIPTGSFCAERSNAQSFSVNPAAFFSKKGTSVTWMRLGSRTYKSRKQSKHSPHPQLTCCKSYQLASHPRSSNRRQSPWQSTSS